jgi:hypothetical protein
MKCATSRKVSGSIPDGNIEIFLSLNTSYRIMALGSTQSLNIEDYQGYPLRGGGKGGGCVGLTLEPS